MSQAFDDIILFIIRKNLEIILDNISADFNIDREKLNPYLKLTQNQCVTPPPTLELSSSGGVNQPITICKGKTKKGESCPNKAKPNTIYCGKHSR